MTSKSEKILKKLEKYTAQDAKEYDKEMKIYTQQITDFQNFVERVDDWYNKNEKRYLRMMSIYDKDEISEREFKLAFSDLRTPFSGLEEHIIYRMVDPEKTGRADYSKLYEGIWKALANKYINTDSPNDFDFKRFNNYFLATFKIPSYEPLDMPTTFEALITQDYTGLMLRELIRTKVPRLSSKAIMVFTEPSKYEESSIKCNQRLFEFNFVSGPKCAPTEITLYYDYSVGRIDCPLLTNVTYFGPTNQKQRKFLRQSTTD